MKLDERFTSHFSTLHRLIGKDFPLGSDVSERLSFRNVSETGSIMCRNIFTFAFMVAIFWDYENCSPPSNMPGYVIANNIRNVAHRFGSVNLFKAYFDFSQSSSPKSLSLRSELQTSGVSLTDCPHNGRKDVADMMILVDMLTYAMDNAPPATIMLISGDRDFAYAASMLRLRQYRMVIIAPSVPLPHITLRSQASVLLDWNADVIGRLNQDTTGISSGNVDRHSASSRSRSTSVPESFVADPPPTLHSPVTLKTTSQLPVCAIVDGGSTSSTLGQPRTLGRHLTGGLKATDKKSNSARRSPSPTWDRNANFSPGPVSTPQVGGKDEWVEDFQDNSHHAFSDRDDDLVVSHEPIGSDWVQTLPALEMHWSTVVGNDYSMEKNGSSSILRDEWTSVDPGGNIVDCPETEMPLTIEPLAHTRPRTTSPTFPRESLSSSNSNDISFDATTSDSGISFIYRDNLKHVIDELAPPVSTAGCLNVDNGTEFLSMEEGERIAFGMIPGSPELKLQQSLEFCSSTTPQTTENAPTIRTRDPVPSSASALTPTPSTPPSDPVPITLESPSVPVTTRRQNRHPFLDSATLVEILKMAHRTGITFATRSSVATILLKRDPTIYQRSGVTTFGEYATLAENAGMVQLGQRDGGEPWIALCPDVLADSAPIDFATLVDILRLSHRDGISRPTRSSVAILLNKRDPTVYQRSGVTRFRQYTALAQSAGVVQLGLLQGGDAWISLHPDWRNE